MSVKNGQHKICTICGKEYYVRASRAENSKYCSKKCWSERRVLNSCEHCGKDITSYNGKKYCSRKCSHEAMVGEKSARWIDGKSLERDRARLGTELKEWRLKVYERDKYTCQQCGAKGKVHAHHKIEWAKNEAERFNVDNGITLCLDCHGKIHKKNFKRKEKSKCLDCGKTLKSASKYCHSCSAKRQWAKRKLDPTLEIKKNGEPYITNSDKTEM